MLGRLLVLPCAPHPGLHERQPGVPGNVCEPAVRQPGQVSLTCLQVQQRDNEINILVSMLKRKEAAGGAALLNAPQPQAAYGSAGPSPAHPMLNGISSHASTSGPDVRNNQEPPGTVGWSMPLQQASEASTSQTVHDSPADASRNGVAGLQPNSMPAASLLADRSRAFEVFR